MIPKKVFRKKNTECLGLVSGMKPANAVTRGCNYSTDMLSTYWTLILSNIENPPLHYEILDVLLNFQITLQEFF